jgi:hypothetical protein
MKKLIVNIIICLAAVFACIKTNDPLWMIIVGIALVLQIIWFIKDHKIHAKYMREANQLLKETKEFEKQADKAWEEHFQKTKKKKEK